MEYINGWSIYPCEGGYKGAKDQGKDMFGTRKRKIFRGKTEKIVKQKIDKYEFEIATGLYTEPVKDTFVEFLKEYHRICAGCDMWSPDYRYPGKAKWAETTAELHKMYIDVHFEPYFKLMKLTDVKPITLDKFYNYCLTHERRNENSHKTYKLTINSVRKLHTFIKAAFNYAKANGLIKENPCSKVILAKQEDYKPKIYDQDKFLSLLEAVTGTDDEIPIILGAGCGFRRGEIFGLRWKDVDFKENTITIEKTNVRFKNYKEKKPKSEASLRTIAVSPYVMDTLRLYRARIGKHNPNDKIILKWKPGSYSERFKKLLEKYELPPTRLHDLRHYNAVLMMGKIPDKAAAKRLGHSVEILRKVYQHVSRDMDIQAANEINVAFERKNSHQVKKA